MIFLLAFLMNVSTGLLVLSNPLLALQLFRADAFMLGLLGTVPAIIYALVCALSGLWGDRIGPRKVIVIACLCLLLVYCSIFLVGRFGHLLLLAGFWGLGGALFWPAMIRWLGEDEREDRLRHRIGSYNIALIAGVMVGPPLAGAVFPFNYRYPYLVAAFLAIVILAILAVAWRRKVRIPESAPGRPEEEGEKAVPGFIYIGWAANFATWFAIGACQSLFPELAKSLPVPISDRMLGILIALIPAGEIAVFAILRKLRHWHYKYRYLFLFQLLGIGGLLIIAFNSAPCLFIPGFLAVGFAGGMTYFSSIYYSVHRQEGKGRKSGFHESFLGFGVALGPLGGGLAASRLGLRAPYLLAAGIFAASIIIQYYLLRRFAPGEQLPENHQGG
ncbi:MAG: MFS transporter [PVC group bacterium]